MNTPTSVLTICAGFCLAAVIGLSPVAGRADAQTDEALKQIIETANQICQSAPLEQTSQGVKLTGDAQAKVGGLVGKIADLGISGAAQYQTGHSLGVLQQDLKDAIQNGNSCKLEVFRTLEKDLIRGRNPDSGQRAVSQPEAQVSLPQPPAFRPQLPTFQPQPASPPGWCARASSQVEQLICRTAHLSALDVQLTDAYQGALSRSAPTRQQNLKREENSWIQQRDACRWQSDVVACVERAYSNRLAVLGTY